MRQCVSEEQTVQQLSQIPYKALVFASEGKLAPARVAWRVSGAKSLKPLGANSALIFKKLFQRTVGHEGLGSSYWGRMFTR